MKKLRRVALIFFCFGAQLFLALFLTLHGENLAFIPYRRAERAAALEALARDQTTENKAAFQQELRLASHHVAQEQFTTAGTVFTVLVIIEILGLSIHWRYKHNGTAPRVTGADTG